MGTLGTGNFDNDAAADLYSSVINPLVKEVFAVMNDLDDIDVGDGEGILIPSLDLLATLAEKYGLPPYFDVQTINRWRDSYLKAYMNAEFSNDSKDFIVERLKTISETFDRIAMAMERCGYLEPKDTCRFQN